MRSEIDRLIFRDVTPNVLLALYEHDGEDALFASKITKVIDSTYSHVAEIITQLEKEGIVTKEKYGRTQNIKLTLKGIAISINVKATRDALATKYMPPIKKQKNVKKKT